MAIERQPDLDDEAFERHVARYRREIQMHCYRMLGSDPERAAAARPVFELCPASVRRSR